MSKEGEEGIKIGSSGEEAATIQTKKEKPWPLRGIVDPHKNDVLFGRGGGTNHHEGNKKFRKIVEDRKLDYVNAQRMDKPTISLEIITAWRAQDPPGRFLKKDTNGFWNDVGDKKAREKTSQALREKAPEIRQQQEELKRAEGRQEIRKNGLKFEEDQKSSNVRIKTTRFSEETNVETKKNRPVLARDHSLGRTLLKEGDIVTLRGFSWSDPLNNGSGASTRTGAGTNPEFRPHKSEYYNQQHSSINHNKQQEKKNLSSRFKSWMTKPAQHENNMNVAVSRATHSSRKQRTGSWSSGQFDSALRETSLLLNPLADASVDQPTPSRANFSTRENSLMLNPLSHASVNQAAPLMAFDMSRSSSGCWEDPCLPFRTSHHPKYSFPLSSHQDDPSTSGQFRVAQQSSKGLTYQDSSFPGYLSHLSTNTTKTWSQQSDKQYNERRKSPSYGQRIDQFNNEVIDNHTDLPQPHMLKRAPSNQNVSIETSKTLNGRSVKRAGLNREISEVSNRLKEKYLPEHYGVTIASTTETKNSFDVDNEIKLLGNTFKKKSALNYDGQNGMMTAESEEQAKLHLSKEETNERAYPIIKPSPLQDNGRASTIDTLTIDALGHVLEDDTSFVNTPHNVEDIQGNKELCLPKPLSFCISDRLSTVDLFEDMIMEPVAQDKF